MGTSEEILGFHASIAGGIDEVPGRIKELECPTGQIFTSNNRQWAMRDLRENEVENFLADSQDLPGGVIAHACYLINLAKEDQEAWEKSVDTLRKEVERADLLNIDYLVLHPGSHVGSGEKKGMNRIIEALDRVIESTSETSTTILVETMAGQGTSLGYKLEQLREMHEEVVNSNRIQYCLDTCHMHAAGYDLGSESAYEESMQAVENILGTDKVRVIHLNDSKKECDSRVDRHEHIGEGTIGDEAFRCFLQDSRWESVPKILETPVDDDWKEDYGRNLGTLVNLVD